jgi:predicted ATPase
VSLSPDPQIGSELLGYRVEAVLGRGGMGVVYRAHDLRLDRKVALKLLASDLADDERFRERFLRESKLAASLDHPHIVPIYAAGEIGGQLYIAMRYVEGSDIKALLTKEGTLAPARTLALLDQVADALDAAHERGLIHRDVKPSNVLVASRAGREHCYLADFGLTKSVQERSHLTVSSQLVGTIDYVAPERIKGEAIDRRADVYALGCLLYECLVGEPPFRGASEAATLYAHLEEAPPKLTDRRPDLSLALDPIIAKALAKQPGQRYQTCSELVGAAREGLEPVPSRTNLPVPATPFLGRQRELAEVVGLLTRDDVRLLTLTGPGGTGKTRLALQAAAEATNQFPDGITWVPLAPLRDPSLVLSTLAHAHGVKEQAGTPLAQGLAGALRGKRCLLLLDNAEHLLPDVAKAVSVLREVDGPTVLVTSRERLQLHGDQTWPVPPLREPDGEELFLARAHAVDPGFASTPAVSELCRRLDELPLAIELAAARTAVFSPDQLLDRIAERLDLFKGGRDADARQQTLRATIEWSHDLLSEVEQRLFHRLGVFVGGCTIEAAEQVVDADPDTLQSLLDKSLLRRRTGHDGQPRYVMLETIREYALDRLAISADGEETRGEHVAYFLKLAEESEPELTGPEQTAWLNGLDTEYGNLREALRVSVEREDQETELRLGAALFGFWLERGYLSEGRRWLETAHEASTGVSAATRAKALKGAGVLAHYQGDYGQAEALCGESLALYRELTDKHGTADALSAFALATRTRGEFTAAQAMFEEALAIFSDLGDKQGVARTLDRLGIAVWFQGDDERARGLLETSLAGFRELGDAEGIGLALVDLGFVALSQADYGRAQPLLEESLAAFKEVGDRRNACKALYALGDLAGGLRDYARAAVHYEESLGISLDLGIPWFTALSLERLAGVAVATGEPNRAARLFGAADARREAIGAPMPAYFGRLYERDLADTRARLDEESFGVAWEEGRVMPVEKVMSRDLVVSAAPDSST